MKATGIVRRIDDLGRVVIPKEIRRTLRIREGDPLEIFTERNGQVIFQKYSPMGELTGFAGEMCESLYKAAGSTAAVCDRDTMIAVSGAGRKELCDRSVSRELEEIMDNRRPVITDPTQPRPHAVTGADGYEITAAAPILSEGDVLGCVMFLCKSGEKGGGELEYKLVQTVAGFLGRQMEA